MKTMKTNLFAIMILVGTLLFPNVSHATGGFDISKLNPFLQLQVTYLEYDELTGLIEASTKDAKMARAAGDMGKFDKLMSKYYELCAKRFGVKTKVLNLAARYFPHASATELLLKQLPKLFKKAALGVTGAVVLDILLEPSVADAAEIRISVAGEECHMLQLYDSLTNTQKALDDYTAQLALAPSNKKLKRLITDLQNDLQFQIKAYNEEYYKPAPQEGTTLKNGETFMRAELSYMDIVNNANDGMYIWNYRICHYGLSAGCTVKRSTLDAATALDAAGVNVEELIDASESK